MPSTVRPGSFFVVLVAAGVLLAGWISDSPLVTSEEMVELEPFQVWLMEQDPPPAARSAILADANPLGIHLSWTEGDAGHSMTVTWLTAGGTNPNQVRYGLTGAYELGTAVGTETATAFGATVHTAVISNLSPGTEYHYSVSPDDTGSWSSDRTFTTAPVGRSPMTFLAAGDSRQLLPWPLGNFDPWTDLALDMSGEEALFTVFSGDAVHDGIFTPQWLDWFDVSEPLASAFPFMPTIGNHEVSGDTDAVKYTTFFTLPEDSGTERWYSYDVGGVHVVVLDSEMTDDAGQNTWLISEASPLEVPPTTTARWSPPYAAHFLVLHSIWERIPFMPALVFSRARSEIFGGGSYWPL